MHCPPRSLPMWSRAAAAAGLFVLSLAAVAQVAEKPARSEEPMAACERSVRQTLVAQGERPAEVTFGAAPAAQPGISGDGQTVLRGEGRWRAASGGVRRFDFSCSFDASTAEVVGVVLRDSTPAVAKAAPARRTGDPDLTHLSLAACESSAVQALKRRWPRVSQITFDSDTRVFRQDTSSSGELHGRGRALPVQGAPETLFGFDCVIDPRDGQVLGTRLSG